DVCSSDLRCHFESFIRVLQYEFLYTEVATHVQQHDNLVSPIAVTVNGDVSAKYFGKRFETIVILRRRTSESFFLLLLVVFLPFPLILPCLGKSVSNNELHTHPCARNHVVPCAMDACRVLSQSELDCFWCAFKDKVRRIQGSIAKLHNNALPADGVGRSMKRLNCCDSSCESAINGDVEWIERIAHP